MSGLVSMAQQFSGLPMKSLIGGPLKAATDANGMMARTQTQFMLSTCFDKSTGGAQGSSSQLKPIMVEFTLSRPVIKGTATSEANITLKLPLLTLIPLNSLAVDDVKVHFEMEVSSSMSKDNEKQSEQETAAKADITAKYNAGLFSVEVHGSVSHSSKSSSKQREHYEASNKAKYEVDVHAGQLPLPTGVTTIINAFTKNIDPIIEKE
ncbi:MULTISPECIES: DUF2589 domain-containing protein [Pseudoalteromonas]|uniref:DUF2589 domain-containing protein n=2 Tax=Pseudoalteromonas rubra TaxID=43658 RepID=A0A0L0ELE8_9GAMM|nr:MULTISPECIES: DUF2589 domain-containing protein [Pseudoalteromonas]KNC65135.1 hypothetical protein AC626_25015 [Pseudoalteromonas rubra]MCG7561382.1 DUF2589 domain-containing protein [Pseudoalteromonas sp. McH1-42]MDK1310145.1 DUF2589 domain-containing protein [Pseudoalteromonas sp. R96]MEC4087967.1 DUF2589 domain-containing protein [Pseudoalteromonas rubra]QPB85959.1 DUF2589 domain-containing protein [Pseudoalteromonas rubra]